MKRIWFIPFIFFGTFLLSITCKVHSCNGEASVDSGIKDLSSVEIKRIIELLEDPEKREPFLNNLRTLLKAKEETERAEAEGVESIPTGKKEKRIFLEEWHRYLYGLTQRITDSALATFLIVARVPEMLEDVHLFIQNEENQRKLMILLLNTGIGIIMGLVTAFFSKRYLTRKGVEKIDLPVRIARGLLDTGISILPYGVMIFSFQVLSDLFPSYSVAHSLVVLFFLVLFFNRFAVAIFRSFISPEDDRLRIITMTEEMAKYIWNWSVRFIRYLSFFFLVTLVLSHIEFGEPQYSFVRGILIIIFSIMGSFFIVKWGRKIRKVSGKRNVLIDYWTIPATFYLWAMTVFIIISYREGFLYLFKASVWTVAILLAILLSLKSVDKILKRLSGWIERATGKIPQLTERTSRFIGVIRKIITGVLWFIAIGFIAQRWGIPVSEIISSKPISSIIWRAVAIGITLGVVIIIIEMTRSIFQWLLKEREGKEPSKKIKTIAPLMSNAIIISSIFIGGVVILDRLGVDVRPILAGAGIAGLAVGFGAQSLVKDIINGLFILFEDSVRVGDVAILKDKGGFVEAITLRSVKLRDVSGNLHVIPNSSIDTVTNMTRGFSMYVFDVGVAYREDVDEVMAILKEIGEEMQNDPEYGKDILEPLEVLGVDRFEDSAVIIKARIKTKPIRQWAVGREFNRRMKKAFDRRGIEIPFPHRTIYMGEPKAGQAPPLVVRLQEIKGGENR